MSEEKDSVPILLLASHPELRIRYEERLASYCPTIVADPKQVRDASRFIDAGAAVVVVDDRGVDATLEALRILRPLPAVGRLVLICEHLSEDRLRQLLKALEPHQVLQTPVPEPLLEWAIRAAVPLGSGRGAREQQRPANILMGVSTAIRKILDEIAQVAPCKLPVMILGETGTGKELVARAVHSQSPRAAEPFVAVNCGALPETLLEEEFFGHHKGAFTGALRDRKGLIEEAHRGTLFLDEIAEMSPMLQVKLLRVLETGELRPIGSNANVSVDVRIVSATHRDLEEATEDGSFRQDLFYRLNAVTLYLPPLRRRRVDVPFLAQHFAEEYGREHSKQIMLGDDFLEGLSQRDFPGNVRELRNAVERALALAAPGETLTHEDLPADPHGRPTLMAMGTLRERIDQVEIQAIREALERFDGNKTRIAESLGVSRMGLRKKMKRLAIE